MTPARAAAAGPAPGDYNPSAAYGHTLASAPAFSMPRAILPGTSAASGAAQQDLPGPGYYYSPSTDPAGIGRGAPAFSMGFRPQQQQQGEEGVRWDSPGPGEYYREAATEGAAFSMAGRPSNAPAGSAPDDTPGSGHYSTAGGASAAASSAAAPAWTIAGRVADAAAAAAAAKARWPGPGSYELGGQGPQGPAYSIQGKAKATAQGQDTPGPLDYCPDPTPLLPSAPCYTIARRTAVSAAAATGCDRPGPGDYEVGAQQVGLSQGPAWTLGARVAAAGATGCESPGPGEYHRPQYPGADGPAFSLAGRLPGALTTADTALLPGPGQYEVPAAPGGAALTIAGRLQTVPEQQDLTPGPGAYLATDFADPGSSSAPAFTISGRPAGPSTDPAAAVPGPGAYAQPDLPRGPAYSLTGRPAATGAQDGGGKAPGPGAYDVGVAESGAPAWTMGAKVPESSVADAAATPAPGDYHPLPDLSRGPAWTLAGKTATASTFKLAASSSAAEQPGPGLYTLHDPQGSGPAVSITGKPGKAEGAAAAAGVAADEPGPGAYFAPKGPEGLAFTFRSRLASSSGPAGTDDTPGPGLYHKEAPAASGRRCSLPPKRARAATALRAVTVPQAAAAAPSMSVPLQSVETTCASESDVRPAARKSPDRSSSAGDTCAAAAGEKGPTLAQLNAQLAALLKHKKGKQLRMQQYCLAV